MYKKCIQNFINKTHPSSADRHSDSSDFEIPPKYLRVATNTYDTYMHTNKVQNSIKEHTIVCNAHVSTQYSIDSQHYILSDMLKFPERRRRKYKVTERNKSGKNLTLCDSVEPTKHYIKRSNGIIDIVSGPERLITNSDGTNSAKNNHVTESTSIDKFKVYVSQIVSCKSNDIQQKKYERLFWHSKKLRKVEDDGSYIIRPIYVIEKNSTKHVARTVDENSAQSDLINSNAGSITFAESEKEIFERSYRVLSSTVSKKNSIPNRSSGMENQNNYVYSIKSSKNSLDFTPCRIPPICESKCVSTDLKNPNKLISSSSAFWNFLSDKVHRRHSKRQYSTCDLSRHECIYGNTDVTAEKRSSTIETQSPNIRKYNNKINQTEFLRKDINCQCKYSSTNFGFLNSIDESATKQSSEINKTKSQQKHDSIAKFLSEKYKGEILCVHNPPCVLINGCLNMCSSNSGHSQLWPVITRSKAKFSHKRKKAKKERRSQYQTSVSKLEVCLPEFKMENAMPFQEFQCDNTKGAKLENSTPRVKYDKLKPHVSSFSDHGSNHIKIPVSSKVYVVVNTNDNNAKANCPHKPQCLMIPKCLARLISKNYIKVKSVPDCVHIPYCEKVPACFGKVLKAGHSKSACHIV